MMVEEMKTNDASRYLVISMNNGNGPDAFKCVSIMDSEGAAVDYAKTQADSDTDGGIYGVYQKLGTARASRTVEWKGAAR